MDIVISGQRIALSVASITGRREENEDSAGWVAITDKGTCGEIANEGAIESDTISDNGLLFSIVCDGMGGLEHGKAVSTLVVKSSLEWIQKNRFEDADDIFIAYREFLHGLEEEIMSTYPKSGTTVVVCFFFRGKWYSMHIGDSRCYSLSKGKITRTRDHSPVEELFRSGFIDENEMNTHPMKNMISAYIGGGFSDKLILDSLDDPDLIILCSDGAYGYSDSVDFMEIIRSSQDSEKIVNTFLEKGSRDNITLISIRFPSDTS